MEPHRSVTREELDAHINEARKPEPGKSIIATPPEDTKIVEALLGKAPGSFGESFITVRGDRTCSNCGRQTTFLDILNDGVAFHGNDFIKNVVEGKRGNVYNPNPPRPHKCYQCGEPSPTTVPGYWCGGYYCG